MLLEILFSIKLTNIYLMSDTLEDRWDTLREKPELMKVTEVTIRVRFYDDLMGA